MSGKDDVDATKRNYRGPYTSHHPIPTIQRYREEKRAQLAHLGHSAGEEHAAENEEDFRHKAEHAIDASRDQKSSGLEQQQNFEPSQQSVQNKEHDNATHDSEEDAEQVAEDTSEAIHGAQDPKQHRKQMKKRKEERAEREVGESLT